MKIFSPEALYINVPEIPPLLRDRYCRALRLEIERFMQSNDEHNATRNRAKSIFMAVQPDSCSFEWLLDTCSILRVIACENAEFSLSSNRPWSEEQKVLLLKVGINRIHYTIQGAMSSWLPYLKTAADQTHAVDLTLGKTEAWKQQLSELVRTAVQHISVYFPEEGNGHDQDALSELYLWAVACLEQAGFTQYSTYDFAKPGYAAIQQTTYMRGGTYQGFGLGACSFDGSLRYRTTNDLLTYCVMQESNMHNYQQEEYITEEQRRFERLMFALTTTGIPVGEVETGLMNDLCAAGLGQVHAGIFSLTPRGRLVENEIITKIFWN